MDGTFKQPYQELEDRFSAFVGYPYAISVNNGTAALTLALAALEVGPGDEVIVPDFSMVAVAFAVSYRGARVVPAGVYGNGLINPAEVEKKITAKTKAIIAVHTYGRICDMVNLRILANDYGIKLIEDRAECIGMEALDKRVRGDIVCYSFYENKTIHIEEGGMI
jgi:dTDP-4-amino-4,6-dideoxygalactose transaminase